MLPKNNSSVIFRFTVPYEEFKADDPEEFRKSLRLSVELFDELLAGIGHEIAREVSLPSKRTSKNNNV